MKKFYLLIGAGAIMVSANAQRATTVHGTLVNKPIKHLPETRAVGDTIMFYDTDVLGGTGVDMTFAVQAEDLDLLTNNPGGGPFPDDDFGAFYSTDPWDFIPSDANDTAYFWAATSWFDPQACCADNWLEMGPINMPAGAGGTLSWHVKNNPSYRDAYEVLISTTGMSSGDFTDAAIYSRTDAVGSNPADTVWTQITATIPSMYNGQTIYIAFHHNANDMDVLYLDNFLLKEAPVGVNEAENAFTMSEVFPNPMSNNATFSINLKEASDVAYTITDLSGKVLLSKTEFNRAAGNNRIEISADGMAAGMYYLNVTAGNSKMTKKIQVIK